MAELARSWRSFRGLSWAQRGLLAKAWLLLRQDLAAGLRIGVARPDGRLAAQAWVEHGGVALGEAENLEERFSSFEETALARGA